MRVTPGIILTAGLVALVYSLVVPQGYSQVVPQKGDWPAYRRDPGGASYSPLAQIDVANVNRLERAWTYHTGEAGRSFEATPIFVNNVLYLPMPGASSRWIHRPARCSCRSAVLPMTTTAATGQETTSTLWSTKDADTALMSLFSKITLGLLSDPRTTLTIARAKSSARITWLGNSTRNTG
jgi:hypothetical protein